MKVFSSWIRTEATPNQRIFTFPQREEERDVHMRIKINAFFILENSFDFNLLCGGGRTPFFNVVNLLGGDNSRNGIHDFGLNFLRGNDGREVRWDFILNGD